MKTQPASKEAIRQFLTGRAKVKAPIPTSDEIRRQLGWPMIPSAR